MRFVWTQAISILSIRIVLIRIRSVCFHSAFCGNAIMMREFSVFHDMRKSLPPIKIKPHKRKCMRKFALISFFAVFFAAAAAVPLHVPIHNNAISNVLYWKSGDKISVFLVFWCVLQHLNMNMNTKELLSDFWDLDLCLGKDQISRKNKHFSIEAHNISRKHEFLSHYMYREGNPLFWFILELFFFAIAKGIFKHCANCIWFHGTNFTSLDDFHCTQ